MTGPSPVSSASTLRSLLGSVASGRVSVDEAARMVETWPTPGAQASARALLVRCRDWIAEQCREDGLGDPDLLREVDAALEAFSAAPSAPPKQPQSTVPRAPVEALLDVLAGYHPHDMPADRRRLDVLVTELRRHLDATTNQPEEGQ